VDFPRSKCGMHRLAFPSIEGPINPACCTLHLQPGLGITIRVESYSADRSSVTVSVCRQGGGQDCSTRATPPYLGSRKMMQLMLACACSGLKPMCSYVAFPCWTML
jgi:hypothetical protein